MRVYRKVRCLNRDCRHYMAVRKIELGNPRNDETVVLVPAAICECQVVDGELKRDWVEMSTVIVRGL